MKIIGVMSQKGGAGKTTVSVHLAVAAHRRGLSVLVVDTDPQGSALTWASYRGGVAPEVVPSEARKLRQALDKLRRLESPPDLVIVDSAPNAGPDAADVAGAVDIVLVPVRPSIFDLAAAKQTFEIVQKNNASVLILLSACPARAPEISMAREALGMTGFTVAKTIVQDRRIYARSIQSGQAVQEIEPDGKAADEINSLLDEVLK